MLIDVVGGRRDCYCYCCFRIYDEELSLPKKKHSIFSLGYSNCYSTRCRSYSGWGCPCCRLLAAAAAADDDDEEEEEEEETPCFFACENVRKRQGLYRTMIEGID